VGEASEGQLPQQGTLQSTFFSEYCTVLLPKSESSTRKKNLHEPSINFVFLGQCKFCWTRCPPQPPKSQKPRRNLPACPFPPKATRRSKRKRRVRDSEPPTSTRALWRVPLPHRIGRRPRSRSRLLVLLLGIDRHRPPACPYIKQPA
jgi:hypothetical protein